MFFKTPGNNELNTIDALGVSKPAEANRVYAMPGYYIEPMDFATGIPNAENFTLPKQQQLQRSMNSLQIDSRTVGKPMF